MKKLGIIAIVIAAAAGILFPFVAGPYPQAIMKTVFIYMALALAWDILIRSGQLSFGIAGFFGLGAYAAVIIAQSGVVTGVMSILFGGLVAGLMAALLGLVILRLRAMYFAITTLALSEIFRIVIHNWRPFTGGPDGKLLEGGVVFGGAEIPSYYLAFGLAVVVILVSLAVEHGRFHFALTSIRNNEIVAKTRGVNIYRTLIMVFSATSALMGMAGATFANLYGFVSPENSFSADFTLLPLAMALLGGMYGTWGPVIGSLLLGILAEYLKLFIPYGHLIVYGIIIVLVILFMPSGIWGFVKNVTNKARQGGGK